KPPAVSQCQLPRRDRPGRAVMSLKRGSCGLWGSRERPNGHFRGPWKRLALQTRLTIAFSGGGRCTLSVGPVVDDGNSGSTHSIRDAASSGRLFVVPSSEQRRCGFI